MALEQEIRVRLLDIKARLVSGAETVSAAEAILICDCTQEILKSESCLIEILGETIIFGDLHGQHQDLLHHFKKVGYPSDESRNFLFLGDFVDRGENSVELICLLFL